MSSRHHFMTLVAWVLVIAPLPAQSTTVPIRKLDGNGLFVSDAAVRVVDGIACGIGSKSRSSLDGAFWDSAGSHDLPPPGGNDLAEALDLNAAGDVVGWSSSIGGYEGVANAVIWRSGTPTRLDSLVTGGDSMHLAIAAAIDAKGRIAGTGTIYRQGFYAYLFDQGNVTKLAGLSGGSSNAFAMNDALQVVGSSSEADGVHAVVWENGTIVDLQDPTQIDGKESVALDIDRSGRICGYAHFKSPNWGVVQCAVLWDHGTVVNLSGLQVPVSVATGMNDFGVVVGWYDDASLVQHACLFEDGGIVDLNTRIDRASGWSLVIAYDVEDEGRIVGYGTYQGQSRAFILEPDCNGRFKVRGIGCPGTGGLEPQLAGAGCPAPEHDFALAISDGLANGSGFLFAGTGTGSLYVSAGCDLQVLPLLGSPQPLVLDGFGAQWLPAHLPLGTPSFDLAVQCLFTDPGAIGGVSATQVLAVHFE